MVSGSFLRRQRRKTKPLGRKVWAVVKNVGGTEKQVMMMVGLA